MTSGAKHAADQAELRLHIVTRAAASAGGARPGHQGCRDWTRREIFRQVREDAELIRFGRVLAGAGRVRLRNAGLIRARPIRARGRALSDGR